MLIVTIQYVYNESVFQSVAVRRPVGGKPETVSAADSATREALNRFEDRMYENVESYEPEQI